MAQDSVYQCIQMMSRSTGRQIVARTTPVHYAVSKLFLKLRKPMARGGGRPPFDR